MVLKLIIHHYQTIQHFQLISLSFLHFSQTDLTLQMVRLDANV